jgi:hypothetical protein
VRIKAVGTVPAITRLSECIYCGSKTNLTREHIVPYGLGCPSEWVLYEGSCPGCARITSAFERDVLEKYLTELRAALGLPTYHKKNRPKMLDMQLLKGGQGFTVSLPAEQCPPLIIMPHFKVPAYIGNYDYQMGVMVVGSSLHGPSDMGERLARFNANGFSVSRSLAAVSFARMLAKIAYGMAILRFGLHAFEEVFVLPCILGQREDVGRWVGCSEEPAIVPEGEKLLHRIEIVLKNNVVSAHIRLFANYKTPVYLVYVGRLKRRSCGGFSQILLSRVLSIRHRAASFLKARLS